MKYNIYLTMIFFIQADALISKETYAILSMFAEAFKKLGNTKLRFDFGHQWFKNKHM